MAEIPQEFSVDEEVPQEFLPSSNGWVIPPVSESDADGFRLPQDLIPEKEVVQGEDVSGLKFLEATGASAIDVAGAIPEVIAAGVTAPVALAGAGIGQLLNLSEGAIEEIQSTIAYEPVTVLGSKLTELLSIPMEAWDTWAQEQAEVKRTALQGQLELAGVDKETAVGIAATAGATEEAITRGVPYILGLLGMRSQGAAIAEKVTKKEKPSVVPENVVEEPLPNRPSVEPSPSAKSYPNIEVEAYDLGTSLEKPVRGVGVSAIIRDGEGTAVGRVSGDVREGATTVNINTSGSEWVRGAGTRAYKDLLEWAGDRGYTVASDADISTSARGVYQKLEEAGYRVEINPLTQEVIVESGMRHTTPDGSPVVRVFPKLKTEPIAEAVGKEWEQALKEDAKRNVEKSLDKTIPATQNIDIVDYRPLSDLEKALSHTVDKARVIHTDKAPVTATVREYKRTEPDLPDRYATDRRVTTLGAGKWIPPSFVGTIKNNSVVKWVTSLIRREEMAGDYTRELVLYGAELKKSFGRYVMKSTDKGLLTKGRLLDDAQKKIFLDILDDYNIKGREAEVSRDALEVRTKVLGFDKVRADQVIDLYYAVRTGLDSIVSKVEKTSDKLMAAGSGRGFKFGKHPGYFPHIWKGDFQTNAYNPKTGQVLEKRTSYTNLPTDKFGAKALELELKEKFPDAEISTRKREFNNLDPAYEALTDIIIQAEKVGDLPLAEAIKKQRGVAGMRAHAMSRDGVRGFEWDPKVHPLEKAWKGYEETLTNFVGAMLRAESGLRIQFNMDNLSRSTLSRLYPNSVTWSKALVDDYLGRKPWGDEVITQITSDFVGQQGGRIAVGTVSKWMTRTQILLGNVVHIAIQLTQLRQTFAKLAGMSSEFGVSGAGTALVPFEAMRDIITRNPEMESALKEAARNGAIDPTMARFLYEEETAFNPKSAESTINKARNIDKNAYSYLDELQRTMSFASFYTFLRKAGRSEYDAIMEATKLTDDYSVKYSPSETPAAQRGVSGSVLGKYQRWASTESAALLEALTAAKTKGDFRQLGVLVAGTATVGGITGLWGMKDADNLVEFTNSQGITNSQLPSMWVMQNAPEWAAVGPVQSSLNMDTSVTASPQMVRNISDLPMLTWTAEVVSSSLNLTSKLIAGRASKLDLERAIMSTTPSSMKEWVRESFERDNITLNPDTWLMKEGESYLQHSLKTGRGTFNVEAEDQLRRVFGGRSLRDAKIQTAARWMYSMEQGSKHDIETLTDYVAKQIIMHGDRANFSSLIEATAEQWNLTPSEINTKIFSKVSKGYKTLEQQLLENKKMQRHTSGKVLDFISSGDGEDHIPQEHRAE